MQTTGRQGDPGQTLQLILDSNLLHILKLAHLQMFLSMDHLARKQESEIYQQLGRIGLYLEGELPMQLLTLRLLMLFMDISILNYQIQ